MRTFLRQGIKIIITTIIFLNVKLSVSVLLSFFQVFLRIPLKCKMLHLGFFFLFFFFNILNIVHI